MSSPDLSVVVPVYNESKVLGASLRRLLGSLKPLCLDFEVIVVDDGSTDRSCEELMELCQQDGRVSTLSLPRNQGKGAALQQGVHSARGKIILTIDADLSTDLEALPRALEQVEDGQALVYGDRRHRQSVIGARQPLLRECLGSLFNTLARFLIGWTIRDYTCGFKAYRRDAALEIFDSIETARWAFDVEVFAIARSRGMRIASLPVHWIHHADTRVRLPGDALVALRDLLRIAIHYRVGAYRQ